MIPLGVLAAIAPAAELLSRWRGREPVLSPVSVRALQGPAEVDYSEAARVLGFRPRPLEGGGLGRG